MKRRHLISCLGALTVAIFMPLAASAGTTTAASKSIMSHHHAKAVDASATVKAKKLDLNSASKEDLMTLPGIDAGTADKIIEGRPYKSMNQLVSKNIVTKAEYTKIRRKVIARQAAAQHSEAPAKDAPATDNASAAPASDNAGQSTTDNTTK
jgi:DNA uptake protein ComE-like DNA-binding protein